MLYNFIGVFGMVDKKSGMYKNLTSYGDEGFSIFLRKAFIKPDINNIIATLENRDGDQ